MIVDGGAELSFLHGVAAVLPGSGWRCGSLRFWMRWKWAPVGSGWTVWACSLEWLPDRLCLGAVRSPMRFGVSFRWLRVGSMSR